ncbi:MAG: preprotein translocase subunit SecY [Patescibacteria group bacterium]
MNFIESLKIIFKSKDLKKRFLIVLGLLLIFRIFSNIPLPEVDIEKFKNIIEANQFLGFINIFSGGALAKSSIALLGVQPYITAFIILEMLTLIFPKLKEMFYEQGEAGRLKFNQYARSLTLPIAFIQAMGFLNFLNSQGIIFFVNIFEVLRDAFYITVGTVILMWIGELITEQKLGNGISLIIFSGIIASLPIKIFQIFLTLTLEKLQIYLPLIILMILIIALVVFFSQAERKIPLVFASKIQGRRFVSGAHTYLPLKLSQAGVIPIIFALALLTFPQTFLQFLSVFKIEFFNVIISEFNKIFANTLFFSLIYFLLVFFFTYFYTSIVFNPEEISKNLQKSGAFISGIRPGKETEKYLSNIVMKLNFFGGLFLGFIAILPYLIQILTKTPFLGIGGTSLLIVVSVAIETTRQINSELTLRKYEI